MASNNIARSMAAAPVIRTEDAKPTAVAQAEAAAAPVKSKVETVLAEIAANNPFPDIFGAPTLTLGNGKLTDVQRMPGAKRETIATVSLPLKALGWTIAFNVYRTITEATIVKDGVPTVQRTADYGIWWPKQGYQAGIGTDGHEGVEAQNAVESWLMYGAADYYDAVQASRGTSPTKPGMVQSQKPRLIRPVL